MTDKTEEFRRAKSATKVPKKNGRPPLRKRGAMTQAERDRRYRAKKKRDNPDAKTLRKQQARAERVAALAARQLALPDKKYGVIYCDPEWKQSVWSEKTGNNKAPPYPTSTHAELTQRDVAALAADDCAMFMWTTNQHLVQALELMAHYGFAYRSHYIWLKPRIGLGFWNRSKHEVLLIGTRGKVPAPAPGTQWESVIAADPPSRLHSAKPEIFAKMIEEYFPGVPKIELNARTRRDNWDVWGDEVDAATELVHKTANIKTGKNFSGDREMLDRKFWPEAITDERLLAAVERRMFDLDNIGFCLACGAEAHGVEPDARRYRCEICNTAQVYGADELLMVSM